MAGPKTYELFISHSWAYGTVYDRLVEFLDADRYFYYRNHSIPKYDPVHTNGTDKQLSEAIERKISGTSIVVIMAGVYSSYSKWINKEIAIAKTTFARPKPILAVAPWGAQKISQKVRDAADEIVGWNSSSIVGGIRRNAL